MLTYDDALEKKTFNLNNVSIQPGNIFENKISNQAAKNSGQPSLERRRDFKYNNKLNNQ